jgi:hypothetical protein
MARFQRFCGVAGTSLITIYGDFGTMNFQRSAGMRTMARRPRSAIDAMSLSCVPMLALLRKNNRRVAANRGQPSFDRGRAVRAQPRKSRRFPSRAGGATSPRMRWRFVGGLFLAIDFGESGVHNGRVDRLFLPPLELAGKPGVHLASA